MCINLKTKSSVSQSGYLHYAQQGFSLIELMVVLLIIGFLSGMVLINMGDNFNRELRSEAERFQQIMIAGSDEAIFSSSEMGVIFQNNGYQLLRLNPALSAWEPYTGSIFELYHLPSTMTLQWVIEGYRRDADAEILATNDLFSNPQFFGDSDPQVNNNELSMARSDRLTAVLAAERITRLDLTPELLLSSSGELPVFEVLFSAVDGVANPARIRVSSDGFSLPSVTVLTPALVAEE